jgi:hypothetical protein
VLGFWEEKGVFDTATVRALHQAMQCPDPFAASQLLPPVPHPMPVVRHSPSLACRRSPPGSLGVVETCDVVLSGCSPPHRANRS